jgi:hypothetical protein
LRDFMASTQENQGVLATMLKWFGMGTPPPPADLPPSLGVTWMLLPPYDIPGMAVVSGLLVENQGEQDATHVHIKLNYTGERFITHMSVVSDDTYEMEGGSPRDSYVNIQLPLFHAGAKVVIYVAGHNVQMPDVHVYVTGYSAPPSADPRD